MTMPETRRLGGRRGILGRPEIPASMKFTDFELEVFGLNAKYSYCNVVSLKSITVC